MAYRLLTGRFVIRYAESPGQGPTPDGDTVKFRPDDPSIVEELGLASGVEPKLSAQHRISLRLEAVDALETNFDGSRQEASLGRAARDALLARLGFRDIVWDPARPGQVASANAGEMPGWVLSDAVEQNGRLVAFAFPGTSPPAADGASVPVDAAMLRSGVNLQMLSQGLVYPLLYTNLPDEVRDLVVELSTAARAGRRGVWARSTADPDSAADLSAGPAALRDLVMWPKLFRRLSRYFAGGRNDLDGFRSWLAGGPVDRDDAVLVLDTGARTRLHDIVDVDPVADTVRLILWPDAFAVLPATTRMSVQASVPAPATRRPGSGGAGSVRLVAALVDAAGPDAGAETVTLLNRTATDLELDGWHLGDSHGDTEALSGRLAAGEALRVPLRIVRLGNGGDTLTLRDPGGRVIDQATWTAADVPPAGGTLVF